MAHGRSPLSAEKPAQDKNPLPEHIGWGSAPLARLLRTSRAKLPHPSAKSQERNTPADRCASPLHRSPATSPSADGDLSSRLIKLFPDIALALLRQRLVAPGRLWLLLRSIDPAGRGWIDIHRARQQLTKNDSPLRVFGWRQMRKLLARGEGMFWQREGRRIWLRSPVKVAAALGINHLKYRPVGLPLSELLPGIGQVRAHFYASFHSGRSPGRSGPVTSGKDNPRPIARATLQALCQTSRRTLRAYERRAGVKTKRNFAIGRRQTLADHQDQAWERGRAVFQFKDHNGRAGREGAIYTAWQLPNSYHGPHEKQPKGRQKRMNHQLADLFKKGMTGNDERAVRNDDDGQRRFFDGGAAATARYNRRPDSDIYWPCRPRASSPAGNQCRLWHWLPAQGAAGRRQNDAWTRKTRSVSQ